jgi:hypothetical protein
MQYLTGIDDTDTKETRGTGFHARQLATQIELNGFGTVSGITRHQNYVHPDIPYTSQNSSVRLVVESNSEKELRTLCGDFFAGDCAGRFRCGVVYRRWRQGF